MVNGVLLCCLQETLTLLCYKHFFSNSSLLSADKRWDFVSPPWSGSLILLSLLPCVHHLSILSLLTLSSSISLSASLGPAAVIIFLKKKCDLDLIARGLFHKKILRQHFFSQAACEIPPHLSWLAEPNPKCGHSSTRKCLYPESTHNILILAVHWGTTQPGSKCYLKCSVYRIHFLFCIFLQGWVRVPLSDQKWNHLKMQEDWWKCPDWSFREYVIMIIQQ